MDNPPGFIYNDANKVLAEMIMQDAQVEFASARRRRAACRVTLTDDNAATADSDMQYAQVIPRRFLDACLPACAP
jgi:hypothetical protein